MRNYIPWFLCFSSVILSNSDAVAGINVGAAVIDVTPEKYPVLVNGGMLNNSANGASSKLSARAIVVADGREAIALVVVDSCMLPRDLLDEVKQLAERKTKIRSNCMMISATHTHTAPAAMGCLGTDADKEYAPLLRRKIVDAIVAAQANLRPAKVGWSVKNASAYNALRRWIIRPDRLGTDPFGNLTVRANMHAANNLDNVTGESGPKDPDLCLISFQSIEGKPIALLANYSMHYFSGVKALNADYFGLFCEGMKERLGKSVDTKDPSFVAMMSHGCSGDIWRRDYTQPDAWDPKLSIEKYTNDILNIAAEAYKEIEYKTDVTISMAEKRMKINYRIPDKQRLLWAEHIVAAMGDRKPKNTEEVYAREQVILNKLKSAEIVVQAIRLGDIAIATTPNETFALTGLKVKLQSPLPQTMVIELANGGDGYIPPPEQHQLGGYTTWAARSAGLEVNAEPRITEAALELLEKVARKPRRLYRQSRGDAASRIIKAKPSAYWRLDEWAGTQAYDASGNKHSALYEPGIVFFLEGPHSEQFNLNGETNRSVHFAGGRLAARLPELGDRYSVSMWIWNGMPNKGRETTGWMFSRGRDHVLGSNSDHLGIGGTATHPGKLIFLHGDDTDGAKPVVGRTVIKRWTWSHVLFVRNREQVQIYLNGNPRAEIEIKAPVAYPPDFDQLYFGGRSDRSYSWEGRLDEIAVFNRAISLKELE